MQIPNIDMVSPQGLQGILNICFEGLGFVGSRFPWIELRCNLEAALFPARCSGEGLLLRSTVGSCCVELVVAAGLELGKDLFVGVERGDTGSSDAILWDIRV